jgi:hypothetical protein
MTSLKPAAQSFANADTAPGIISNCEGDVTYPISTLSVPSLSKKTMRDGAITGLMKR